MLSPVCDELGVVRVLQGAQRLLEVGVRGRQTGDHQGAGVAPKGVLQPTKIA